MNTNTLTQWAALLALAFPFFPAQAADFSVRDLSGTEYCLPTAFYEAVREWSADITRCSPYPAGMVEVLVTPAAGELPVSCYGNGAGGEFCMYEADVYLAAYHDGQWLAKTTYDWVPTGLDQLVPYSHWAPWGGTRALGFTVHAGTIDLNTSRYAPPPEGFEVYLGLTPKGSKTFTPGLVKRIYPVTTP